MTAVFIPDGALRPRPLAPGLFTACLPSGLRVIVKEDHRSQVAICNVWVGAGSNREPESLRGWSHGIEHMLFKGTARRGGGDFAREVAEAGGSTNAGTGYETTDYHITLPAAGLQKAVDILGDALLHSAFADDELDAEREVLVHENHMYDDLPFGFGVTWRWAMELAFDASPYRHPIGGRDENLRERSRQDILAYWRSAYRPSNMAVVIVGAVAADDALAFVKDRFDNPAAVTAGEDPQTALVAAPPVEPAHTGPRVRLEAGDIHKTYAKLVFPAPSHAQDPHRAMAVIRQVLAAGRSGRLYRQVQEERQLVDDFLVLAEVGPREGVVVLDLETDAARLPRTLAAVCAVLEDLKRDGCTSAELERAQVQVARGFLFGTETVQGQARNIGQHLVLEDLQGAFRYPDLVAQVTTAEVAALAARVFRLDQASVVIYVPAGTQTATAGIPATPQELTALLGPVLGSTGPGIEPRQAAAVQPSQDAGTPSTAAGNSRAGRPRRGGGPAGGGFAQAVIAGGVAVDIRVDRTIPVVALALTTIGGAARETAESAGLANLVQMVQVKDAAGLDSESLHGRLEGEGAAVVPVVDRDYAGFSLTALGNRLERPLALLGDIVRRPDFRPDQIERERRLALEQLTAMQDNPMQAGMLALRDLLYGDHPYGRPLVGTAGSLPGLDRPRILAAHALAWTRSLVRVCVSGDCDPDRLLPQLESVLAGLPSGPAGGHPDPGPARVPQGIQQRRLPRRLKQCVLLMGWPGALDPDEGRPQRMVLREILNGQSGRLFEQLRNRQSLCYNTGVMSTAGFGQGMVLAYVMTAPESEAQARQALLGELDRIAAQPVGPAELAKAKAKLIGNLLISHQANGAKVGRAARNGVFGRPADDLPALTAAVQACDEQAVREAAGWFDAGNRCEVVVGPESG